LFRVKICGITALQDLELASRLGADACGFNFFRGSTRHIEEAKCRQLIGAHRDKIELVGVFVNENPDVINRISDFTGLSCVQLSGDEGEEEAKKVERKTIKVFRARTVDDVRRAQDFPSDWIMFDTPLPERFGGTGRTFDHELVLAAGIDRPFLLAGGLTPDNVFEIIKIVRPYGVDVASGVESEPGRKDPKKLKEFIKKAVEAFCIEDFSEQETS
jgi:phosphoribosylanthranilate isomerase